VVSKSTQSTVGEDGGLGVIWKRQSQGQQGQFVRAPANTASHRTAGSNSWGGRGGLQPVNSALAGSVPRLALVLKVADESENAQEIVCCGSHSRLSVVFQSTQAIDSGGGERRSLSM
jgi:hypothetical protein